MILLKGTGLNRTIRWGFFPFLKLGLSRKQPVARIATARPAVCFLSLCLVLGCSHSSEEEASFMATVIEINPSALLVEPEESSVERRSANRITVHIGNAVIADAQGKEVDLEAFKAGSRVRVVYDGRIAESYPAQVWGLRVQLLE